MKLRLSNIFCVGVGLTSCVLVAQTIEVTSTGVGLGTSTPSAPFEVNSSSSLLAKFTRPSAGPVIQVGASDSAAAWFGYVLASDVAIVGTPADPYTFSVKGNGNVGIGTTSPARKLSVRSTATTHTEIADFLSPSMGSGQLTYALIGRAAATGECGIWGHQYESTTSNSFTWIANYGDNHSSGSLAIKKGGNVGIGTSSPSRKLDVNGDANIGTNLVVQTAMYYGTSYSLGSGFTFRDSTSGDLIKIAEGGNVGIGTTSPGYKLEVSGSVRATSFISNSTTYADFVFKPGYRLAPLTEVEAAIKEHGHLPEIPSEAEAKAHGVDLAQMQTKLLQKVEELTLHLIAHEKNFAAQRQELERLSSENKELRKEISILKQPLPSEP